MKIYKNVSYIQKDYHRLIRSFEKPLRQGFQEKQT